MIKEKIMEKIGISLSAGLLSGCLSNEINTLWLQEYGSVKEMLSLFGREGIYSIEIRDCYGPYTGDQLIQAVHRVHEAGLRVTLHLKFNGETGAAYLNRFRDMLAAAAEGQEQVPLTVHPDGNAEKTILQYRDWYEAFSGSDGRLRLVLENNRVKKTEDSFMSIRPVSEIIREAEPENGGICWDMGHYAWNLNKAGNDLNTLPGEEILSRVLHTHIHGRSLENGRTHFPLGFRNEPAEGYVRALKKAGYHAIYNLELSPERFLYCCTPREGLETSLSQLKAFLNNT